MPPKQKITKEVLLEEAYKITEQAGINAVTSRSVAKAAGCSIQPVFSHFPTMEALRQATFDYACEKFMAEVLAYEGRPDFFACVTGWTVDLARERPNLYKLLYLSDGFSSHCLMESMAGFESNRRMLAKMEEVYGLSGEKCRNILMRSCLMLMGICTMICINHMDFTREQVMQMMQQTVTDMVKGGKEE